MFSRLYGSSYQDELCEIYCQIFPRWCEKYCNLNESTTEPNTTKPSTTEPSTTEPSSTEPITTEPSTTEHSTTEPSSTKPSTTEPITTEPSSEEPSTKEPSSDESNTEEPSIKEPLGFPESNEDKNENRDSEEINEIDSEGHPPVCDRRAWVLNNCIRNPWKKACHGYCWYTITAPHVLESSRDFCKKYCEENENEHACHHC